MRKPFSFLPIFIFAAFPVCAEFTIPFPEGSRRGTEPSQEQATAEKSTSRTAFLKEKDPKKPRPEIGTEKKQSSTVQEEAELPKVKRTALRTGKQNGPLPPKFYRGLYVNNSVISEKGSRQRWENLLSEASDSGVNVLVIDIQSTTPPASEVNRLKELGFYPVARLVNFDGGLKTELPTQARMDSILGYVKKACAAGFPEIQLDYIRYADVTDIPLTLKQKYKNIESIITKIRTQANECEKLPYLGADIFGRIPFNKDDQIGQKVENFAELVDVLYPMLYPSHFYHQPARISNPYQTVFDGLSNAKKRSPSNTRVVGWIQGFNMSIASSKKNLKDYIKAQIEASVESKSDGFVVWNIGNNYAETFRAMKESVKDGKLPVD